MGVPVAAAGRRFACRAHRERLCERPDLAAFRLEGSVAGQEVDVNGVSVIGLSNLPGRVTVHASQMYSSNVSAMLSEYWDAQSKNFVLNQNDEIIRGCLVTHGGLIVNETIKAAYAAPGA